MGKLVVHGKYGETDENHGDHGELGQECPWQRGLFCMARSMVTVC